MRSTNGPIMGLALGSLFFCFAMLVGCDNQKQAAPKPVTVDESKRPPLRIVLVDCPELAEPMEIRWQSTSQQKLDIKTVSSKNLIESKSLDADLVVYPSGLIGGMVQLDLISQLPAKVIDVAKSGAETEGVLKWPAHWLRSATYGKRVWGVVLGAPLPVVIRPASNDTDAFQIESLQALKSPSQPVAGKSAMEDSDSLVESDWLVDRFLVFLADEKKSSNQLGWFFQLSDMSPRLLDAEFAKAAHKFTDAAATQYDSWRASHTANWDLVKTGQAAWGLGYPGIKPAESQPGAAEFSIDIYGSLNSDESKSIDPKDNNLKIATYDAGHGLMVSMASTNRQSATSTYFLEWLNNENQRIAFGAVTERVNPLGSTGGVTPGPEVMYQRKMTEAWGTNVPNELRFAGAYRYRNRLQQMLEAILANPAMIEEELAKCNQDWDKITEELGRARQRTSVELSLFLTD